MGKRKTYDDGDASVEATLWRIQQTANMRENILKELKLNVPTSSPEDMYAYEIAHPDYTHTRFHIYHGKCFESGFAQLKAAGYTATQIDHFLKSDKTRAGSRCLRCKEQLDPTAYIERKKEKAAAAEKRAKAYAAWCKKQILLGKM